MDERDDQIREILDSIPERLKIVKDGIDFAVQQEYLKFTKMINLKKYAQEDISAITFSLFKSGLILEKKKALAILAQQGTLEAYRTIEKFLESEEQELKDWGVLAQEECRILLESSLSDRNAGIVITGLGGEYNRLRYYVVVRSRNDAALTDAQKENISRRFSHICSQFDSILEEIQPYQHYVAMRGLIPMDIAVADVIEGGINECNAFGDFLDETYYVTNIKIPTEAEIQQYFIELRRDEE